MAMRVVRIILVMCSLVLCLAAAGMWARSYRVIDQWGWSAQPWTSGPPSLSACSRDGLARLFWTRWEAPPDLTALPLQEAIVLSAMRNRMAYLFHNPDLHVLQRPHMDLKRPWVSLLGFNYTRGNAAGPRSAVLRYKLFVVPYWAIVLASGIAPVVWTKRAIARFRRRRRQSRGLCTRCGYDLRESRERCPECGTTIPTPAVDPAPIAH